MAAITVLLDSPCGWRAAVFKVGKHGSTDDLGLWAVSDKAHVQDIHASILHTIGLDHMMLEFKKGGRRSIRVT